MSAARSLGALDNPIAFFTQSKPTRLSRAKSRDVAQRVSTSIYPERLVCQPVGGLDTNGEGALAVP